MNLIEKMKLLFVARKPIMELTKEVKDAKDNWKKIRFWISILGSLMALVASIQGFMPVTAAVCVSAGLSMIYNIVQSLKDADTVGFSPLLKSTKFWMGVVNAIAIFLASLKTGGINPQWVTAAIGGIGAVTLVAREIGNSDPGN